MAEKFINRYIDNYATIQEIDPKTGKTVTRRVYQGPLYKADMTDSQWKKTKWLFTLTVVIANALLVTGALMNVPSNIINWVVIPEALGLFGLLGSIYLAILLHLARYPFTSYYYHRCSNSLRHVFAFNCICFSICTIEAIICGIIFRQAYLIPELITAALMAAGSLLYYLLYKKEKSLHYVSEK